MTRKTSNIQELFLCSLIAYSDLVWALRRVLPDKSVGHNTPKWQQSLVPVPEVASDAPLKFQVERVRSNPLIGGIDKNPLRFVGLNNTDGLAEHKIYNINGPSIIKVPDWVPNKLGNYYMYFAHHTGSYIRLAYANAVEGPWKIHNPSHGVFSIHNKGCGNHVASPDVHVDHANKRIVMYFHTTGHYEKFKQHTPRPIFSADGFEFKSARCDGWLASFYLRTFQHNGTLYGIAKKGAGAGGVLYKSPSGDGSDFKQNAIPILSKMRHCAVWENAMDSGHTYVLYTNIDDKPEQIWIAQLIQGHADFHDWKLGESQLLLAVTEAYEGGDIEDETSSIGAVNNAVKAVRDPAIFVDGKTPYVFYSVAGEQGIAAARISIKSHAMPIDEYINSRLITNHDIRHFSLDAGRLRALVKHVPLKFLGGSIGILCIISLLIFIVISMASESTKAEPSIRVCNELLMTIAIIATAFQGGGLIFGFSSFASRLLQMNDPRFSEENVPEIFAAGHQITALGCILSGFAMNFLGARRLAVLGLIMEALGLFMLAHITDLPFISTIFAYGLVGWGGCHVLMASLTLAPAFKNANFMNSLLTVAFQCGGAVFMALPYVQWQFFFNAYALGCLATAVVFVLIFPNDGLPTCDEEAEPTQDKTSLKDVLLLPKTIWFMITFMIAGNALIYVGGEFPVALQVKDACVNGICTDQATQDLLNNVEKPLFGNFILPVSCALGIIIDRWGFSTPAFVKVLSTQILVLSLWLCELKAQLFTILAYNVANATVFTVQNAYISNFSTKHIGNLFSISNLVLGVGNFFTNWFASNPFGVAVSLGMSSLIWFAALCPAYYWGLVVERNSNAAIQSPIDIK